LYSSRYCLFDFSNRGCLFLRPCHLDNDLFHFNFLCSITFHTKYGLSTPKLVRNNKIRNSVRNNKIRNSIIYSPLFAWHNSILIYMLCLQDFFHTLNFFIRIYYSFLYQYLMIFTIYGVVIFFLKNSKDMLDGFYFYIYTYMQDVNHFLTTILKQIKMFQLITIGDL